VMMGEVEFSAGAAVGGGPVAGGGAVRALTGGVTLSPPVPSLRVPGGGREAGAARCPVASKQRLVWRLPGSGQAQCTSRRDFAHVSSSTHRAFHGERAGKNDHGGLGDGCEIRSAKTRHNRNCIEQGNRRSRSRHCAADGVSSVERTRILPRGLGHTGNELGHKGTTAERRLSAKR
jgi:hypothetical protein